MTKTDYCWSYQPNYRNLVAFLPFNRLACTYTINQGSDITLQPPSEVGRQREKRNTEDKIVERIAWSRESKVIAFQKTPVGSVVLTAYWHARWETGWECVRTRQGQPRIRSDFETQSKKHGWWSQLSVRQRSFGPLACGPLGERGLGHILPEGISRTCCICEASRQTYNFFSYTSRVGALPLFNLFRVVPIITLLHPFKLFRV
jgi:hypothetical protein